MNENVSQVGSMIDDTRVFILSLAPYTMGIEPVFTLSAKPMKFAETIRWHTFNEQVEYMNNDNVSTAKELYLLIILLIM